MITVTYVLKEVGVFTVIVHLKTCILKEDMEVGKWFLLLNSESLRLGSIIEKQGGSNSASTEMGV